MQNSSHSGRVVKVDNVSLPSLLCSIRYDSSHNLLLVPPKFVLAFPAQLHRSLVRAVHLLYNIDEKVSTMKIKRVVAAHSSQKVLQMQPAVVGKTFPFKVRSFSHVGFKNLGVSL